MGVPEAGAGWLRSEDMSDLEKEKARACCGSSLVERVKLPRSGTGIENPTGAGRLSQGRTRRARRGFAQRSLWSNKPRRLSPKTTAQNTRQPLRDDEGNPSTDSTALTHRSTSGSGRRDWCRDFSSSAGDFLGGATPSRGS